MIQKYKKVNKISESISTKWQEAAEFRSKNKWLIYSSKIARRILAAINENDNLNQAKLAVSLNVSPQQISKIVKGKENLTLETIYKLSQALGVELISFPNYSWSDKQSIEVTVNANSADQPTILVFLNINMPVYLIEDGGIDIDISNVASFQFNNSYVHRL